MGVVSQAFYVGAQIMCWTYIYHYAEHIGIDSETAGYYQFVAFVVFFLGRFVCTFLMRFINSGRLLMILSMLAVACTLGTIFIEGIYGLLQFGVDLVLYVSHVPNHLWNSIRRTN